MKKLMVLFSVTAMLLSPLFLRAQIAISADGSAPNASSMLDVKSTDKGVLVPRLTTAQRNAISSPATGLLVFDTTTESFWFKGSSDWLELRDGNIATVSDADNDTKVMVDYNPDEDIIRFTTGGTLRMALFDSYLNFYQAQNNLGIGYNTGTSQSGQGNAFYGYNTGQNLSTGFYNTGMGYQALQAISGGGANCAFGPSALRGNIGGSWNCAFGSGALQSNIEGAENTAVGENALEHHKFGNGNTAIGAYALFSDTTGFSNVAIGAGALYISKGRNNLVAVGDSALYYNTFAASTGGTGNTALGSKSLYLNGSGYSNTATGYHSLRSNTSGYQNTATGYNAMYSNTNGHQNAAYGFESMYSIYSGHQNTAEGYQAAYLLYSGNYNTATGLQALYSNVLANSNAAYGFQSLYSNTANSNAAFGYRASYQNTTGSYNTAVGTDALRNNQTGTENVAVGEEAGFGAANNSFSYNAILGCKAGKALTTGSNNILVGYSAADNLTSGSNNIIIGYNIDATSASKSNEMILGSQDLLYGDLTNKRIGIGTTAPTCQLHLQNNGDVTLLLKADADNVNEDDNPRIELKQDGTSVTGAIGYSGSDNIPYQNGKGNGMYIVNEYNAPLQFGADSLVYMTVLPPGRLGIMTNAPEQALHVVGSAKISSLTVNGPVYSNSGVLTNTNPSDFRLKENITPLGSTLDKIMGLHPVTFDWRSDGKQGTGFIAQEMEAVIPGLVATGEDGYKGIYTVEIIPYLVKALQEQQTMIGEMERRIEELESGKRVQANDARY
jgi:trimeric autotransporter adhesin